MGSELQAMVVPREIVRSVKLRTKDKDKGATERLKRGAEYAEGGSWDMASEEWEQVLQQNPDCAAAHYNLGVAREAEGQLERAREHYKKAARIDPDKLYVGAVVSVDERLKQADELQRQMEGRESADH
jgi:Tfp pilus assembly protein PilF